MAKELWCETCGCTRPVVYSSNDEELDIDTNTGEIEGTVTLLYDCEECGCEIGMIEVECSYDSMSYINSYTGNGDVEYSLDDYNVSVNEVAGSVELDFTVSRTIKDCVEASETENFNEDDVQEA